MHITVLGATGKTGRVFVERLAADGHALVAVGRSLERLEQCTPDARHAVADLARPETLTPALAGAEVVVSLAHAGHAATVLAALPGSCRRVVLTGSVRRHSRLPDPAAEAVRAGAAAFRDFQSRSAVEAVWLDPSMIYGAPEDRGVGRILRLMRRWPGWLPMVLPLPDGGRRTVQPVFIDDMVEALAAALSRAEAPGGPIVVAGPAPMTYAAMVRACARALGRRVAIAPLPAPLLAAMARLGSALGRPLPVSAAELMRASEDKAFEVADLRRRLGVEPRSFAEGLRLTIARSAR